MFDAISSADFAAGARSNEDRREQCPVVDGPMVYPVLNGRWDISDHGLCCSLPRKAIRITAPRAWLEMVSQLCDGRRKWAVVEREMTLRGGSRAAAFLQELASAGAVIEAGAQLAQQARVGWVPQRVRAPLSTLEELDAHRKSLDRRLLQKPGAERLRPSETALSRLLERRGSAQTFGEPSLPLASIVNILWSIYGVVGESGKGHRRTVPSGGALYAVDWYLALLVDTEGYSAGLHAVRYHAGGGGKGELSLVPCKGSTTTAPWSTLLTPAVLTHAQAVIYPVANLGAIEKKYGNRALTLAMLEVGHALQNAALAATLEDAATIVRGDTIEAEVQAMLGLSESMYPLPALVLGRQPSQSEVALAREASASIQLRNVPNSSRSLSLASQLCVAGPIQLGKRLEFRVWAAGRSTDPRLAATKAEAEAWERIGWATPRTPEMARMRDVPRAVAPARLVAYSSEQLQREDFPFAEWSDRRSYPWTSGVDVATGESLHLMAQCVYALSSLDASQSRFPYTNASTSGVAAWTDAQGAVSRAVVELVERDAFARAWLRRLSPPLISAASLPAELNARLSALREAGYRASVHLLASPHLPVVCVFAQNDERHITSVTTGAGFSMADAMEAALREAESRLQDYHGRPAPDEITPVAVVRETDHAAYYRTVSGFRSADFLASNTEVASRTKLKVLDRALRGGAPALLSTLHAKQMPVYACDLTPPGASIGQGRTALHVWRAFVPGLLPLWFGCGTEPLGLIESGAVALPLTRAQKSRLLCQPGVIHPCT